MSTVSAASSLQALFANLRNVATKQVFGQANDSSSAASAASGAKGSRHHGGGKGLRSQIESAVTTALSNASPGSDIDETIRTAIENVLKQGKGASTASGGNLSPTDNTDKPQPNFASFLQAHGVSAAQFSKDLKEAVKEAWVSGKLPDTSSAFAQLPSGSELDVQA